MNDDDDDDDTVADEPEELVVYSLDADTHELIELACNCLAQLSEAQIHDESAAALLVIADRLAERFAIGRLDQEIHETEDGEQEIIFRPDVSLFPETPEDPTADPVEPAQ